MPSLYQIAALTMILSSDLRSSALAFTAGVDIAAVGRSAPLFFRKHGKYSYDLGLGKHSPLIKDDEMNHHRNIIDTNDVYHASRFLSVHESAQPFPTPQEAKCEAETIIVKTIIRKQKQEKVKKPRRKPYPKVQPKRQLEDVLFILTNDNSSTPKATTEKQLPVMVQPGNSQLDLNSIWVEMMLHDQQSMAAAAAHSRA